MIDDMDTRFVVDQAFTPKDRADKWRIYFGPNTSSGYDFLLTIENPDTAISYQIEVGIMADGRLCGQITPDEGGKGPDALVLFDTTPDTARISGNYGGAALIISLDDENGTTVVDTSALETPRGFY